MPLSDAYRAAVMGSNPSAYWPLSDRVNSIAAVELVNNLNGVVMGSQTFGRPDPWGEPYACTFDGVSGFIVDMRSRPMALAPFSIECWYRTGAQSATLAAFNAGQLALDPSETPFLYLSGGKLRVYTYGGSVPVIEDPNTSNDGQWHHAVGTYQGGNLTLYRDGVQVAYSAGASPTALTGFWHIANGNLGGFLLGDLCHVAIYPTQLSAATVAAHFAAFSGARPPEPEPGPPVNQRKAWLVLGQLTRPLDDLVSGWACTSLDLGGPVVREVVNNSPDQHGTDDRTQYLGSRVVTANITAVPDGSVPLDEIVQGFAPFLDPSARPELHYTLMDTSGLERVLILRATAWSAEMSQPVRRDFQLSWVAPDPIIRSAVAASATAWSGSSVVAGRVYNLTFNRAYPAGSGGYIEGIIVSNGDLPVAPVLQLFGPITDPQIFFYPSVGSANWRFYFDTGFRVDAGHFLQIDCAARTAYLDNDPTQNMLPFIDWVQSRLWPQLPVAPTRTNMSLYGSSATNSTQVRATWNDRFVT
jgi:hypothetical protein